MERDEVNLIVNLDRELHSRFKSFCRANKVSMAKVIRGVIRDMLDKHNVESPLGLKGTWKADTAPTPDTKKAAGL